MLSQVDERGELESNNDKELRQTDVRTESTVRSQKDPETKIRHESNNPSFFSRPITPTDKNENFSIQDEDEKKRVPKLTMDSYPGQVDLISTDSILMTKDYGEI